MLSDYFRVQILWGRHEKFGGGKEVGGALPSLCGDATVGKGSEWVRSPLFFVVCGKVNVKGYDSVALSGAIN